MVVLHPQPSRRTADREYKILPKVIAELQKTPWCRQILEDSSFVPLLPYTRDPPPYLAGRYTLMGKTFKTAETVPIWQVFYRPSRSDSDPGEVRILLSLGSDMDGHLHTAHGGAVSALLDEACGTIAGIHMEPGKSAFTAFMNINYKKPVPTPGVCVIIGSLNREKSKGRKIYVTATLESGEGVVYSSAESMFVEVERKHRKPLPKI